MTKDNTYAEAASVAMMEMIGDHFLEVARHLREVHDLSPEDFRRVAKTLKIGQRKAYALAQIDRVFNDLSVPRERLRNIGWTKLSMIAGYVNADNSEAMLQLAEKLPPLGLRRVLRGEPVSPDGRVLLLLIRKEHISLYDAVFEKYGATQNAAGGWTSKETALAKALAELMNRAT